MGLEDETSTDISDDLFQGVEYVATKPAKRPFLPWHRPRKQYVRKEQWLAQINLLVRQMPADESTLRYLGLPGPDLLDLRYIHDHVCKPSNLRLKFLGFNTEAQPNTAALVELNTSLAEVKSLGLVHHKSNVLPDDFRSVARETSQAWRTAADYGPYDIVNLDLCGSFATEEPGTLDNSHYNALARLLSLQAKRKTPWLLLLTTRVGHKHVNAQVLSKLVSNYLGNLSSSEAFRQASEEHFNIIDEGTLSAAKDQEDGLLNVFLTGLCKWLLECALDQRPPTIVELTSVIGYSVYAKSPLEDLVSLAIKFTPTLRPVRDRSGLSGLQNDEIDEAELAMPFISKINGRQNADTQLAQDEGLRKDTTSEMAELLKLARYDIDEYMTWASSFG